MRYEVERNGAVGPRYHLLLAAGLIMAASYSSAAAEAASRYALSLGADYRRAQLDWNIAGDLSGHNPNIRSELTWRDLDIAQVSAVASAAMGEHVVIQAGGDYGEVASGKNQDSDYAGDNRSLEFSRSNNDAAGSVSDAGIGLGYRFRFFSQEAGRHVLVTPMAGYSVHYQNLTIGNGAQTIPATGPIAGLNSTYDAGWEGPWLGLNMRFEVSERTTIVADTAYHWADYTARADWNLRNDVAHPVSFRQGANGAGVVAALAVTHTLNRDWEIVARLESQNWTAGPGADILYTVDGKTGKIQPLATRLNAVHWKSQLAGLAAAYHF